MRNYDDNRTNSLCDICHGTGIDQPRTEELRLSDGDVSRAAKVKRILERDGLRKRRMNEKDKALARMLERQERGG